jgi:hypothetical protein
VEARGEVTGVQRLGEPIAIAREVDPIALGSVIHGFLATDRAELDPDARSEVGARLLESWGVQQALPLERLLEIGERLQAWLAAEWPGATVRHEWPIEQRLAGGTVLRGRADLFVTCEDRAAVVDHKVIVDVDDARAIDAAAIYAGQLQLYADAIAAEKVHARVDTLVHLPLAGMLVRLGSKPRPAGL